MALEYCINQFVNLIPGRRCRLENDRLQTPIICKTPTNAKTPIDIILHPDSRHVSISASLSFFPPHSASSSFPYPSSPSFLPHHRSHPPRSASSSFLYPSSPSFLPYHQSHPP